MSEKIDVLISGLGPAGALTAQRLAHLLKEENDSFSVLAIDRKKVIGEPVFCGEFMPAVDEMQNLMPEAEDPEVFRIDEKYFYTKTTKIIFVNPRGSEKETQFQGYSFDRARWLQDLVDDAKLNGIEAWTSAQLESYNFQENIVKVRHNGELKLIEPKILICAEGYHSVINKAVNLTLHRQKNDYVATTGFQIVTDLQENPEEVYMYFGKHYSPGAYAWIIPKGNYTANIGTGLRLTHKTDETAAQIMKNLFTHPHAKKFLNGAKPTNKMGKPVPVGLPPTNLIRRNVIGIGDAVNQVISAVGAGIPPAQLASELLSKSVVNALLGRDSLEMYERAAERHLNPAIRRSWKLRKIFDEISTSDSRLTKYFSLLSRNDIRAVTIAHLNLKLRLLAPFIPLGNLFFT
ncbi:MAG: geranylgeranyl reductase family protein [Promethearchaeota archaeon]